MRTGHPTAGLARRPPRAAVYQMAYFPPVEYETAWAKGLLNPTSYRDHADYRRETEQEMQALAQRSAGPIRVVPLNVPDLLAYAQRAGKDPAHRRTRLAYTGGFMKPARRSPGRRSATSPAGADLAPSTRSAAAPPASSPSSRPIRRRSS